MLRFTMYLLEYVTPKYLHEYFIHIYKFTFCSEKQKHKGVPYSFLMNLFLHYLIIQMLYELFVLLLKIAS